MRQQLVSWLIEDIAPEVRKTKDAEGTIIKFAKEKNLEPALVQSLGQMFNTAKTLAFAEKAANKGDSFPLLDVDAMLGKYLEVRPKSATSNAGNAYDELELGRDNLPALFSHIPGLKIQVETGDVEASYKIASETPKMSHSEYMHQSQLIDDTIFNIREDMRELLQKAASHIKNTYGVFHDVERDMLAMHGDAHKPAIDMLADFCKAAHVKVERATDGGPNRLVVSEQAPVFEDLEKVSHCMLKLKIAHEMKDELVKQAGPLNPAVMDAIWEEVQNREKASLGGKATAPTPAAKTPEPSTAQMEHQSIGKVRKPVSTPGNNPPSGGGEKPSTPPGYFSSVMSALGSASEPYRKAPEIADAASKILGNPSNTDQQHVDNAYEEARHTAVLQNLLSTDEVLADADHDSVVNMYNTLRRLSPSIAADPNIARVALRTMIQHDGMSPFDAKSLLDTENTQQKVEQGKRTLDDAKYKGKPLPGKPM